MSDPKKFPFDSIPLDGATATADPPRPSFSRSVPDAAAGGLLPPTRKPVSVTMPDSVALTTSPAADPNPMASTPPPMAGSARGFLWDLVRPTRTKWAILAGGVSLAAGAYGLNLVVPTPGETPKVRPTETAKLTGPQPQIGEERQRQPVVGEERVVAALPKESVPSPLGPLPAPPIMPVIPIRHEEPAPLPALPKFDDKPTPAAPLPPLNDTKPALLPIPALNDKPDPVPLPPVVLQPSAPTPLPAAPKMVGDLPPLVDPSLKPVPPVLIDAKPPTVTPLPLPKPPFAEVPDLPKKVETLPVVLKPDPVPLPDMKVTPVGETKLPPIGETKLPPVGGTVELPKPVEPQPVLKPSELVSPKPADAFPPPKPVAIDPVPAPPIKLTPVLREEPPAFTVVGTKEPPPAAPVGGPPPKKGFDVDVVKVRANDTYTSISDAFYQSKKYAPALRAFNGDADIGRLQEVEVPPLHELQKLGGVPAREAEPTGSGRAVISPRTTTPTEPAVRGPVFDPTTDSGESADWGPAGKRRAVIEYKPFTVPKDGVTPRDVARFFYDDENQWPKLIGPRGAKLRGDEPLPRGTKLTVPQEEPQWK